MEALVHTKVLTTFDDTEDVAAMFLFYLECLRMLHYSLTVFQQHNYKK